MDNKYSTYSNPLTERYCSKDMSYIFSPQFKFSTWRKLWIALAEGEKELGINITDEQIEELKAHVNDINFDDAKRIEREVRHDVMSHVQAYGLQCPKAKGIIHLGATSAYVGDNTDVIQMNEALKLIRIKLVNLINNLKQFALKNKDIATLGFTHFQAAQLTTVGKRATLWAQDLIIDLEDLNYRLENMKLRGVKGTTGTQASFVALFEGDNAKIKQLDKIVCNKMGFESSYAVSGQTYTRKLDSQVLNVLAGIAQSMHKMTNDIRLLQHLKELEEPFEKKQIGSSAMAYKRNPMRSERISSLSKFIIAESISPAMVEATQWLERSLDDSANKRLSIPQAFMAADAILEIGINVTDGLVVYESMINKHINEELPFMATENILMEAVKRGGDRQELHEEIRELSMKAAYRVKHEGLNNNLIDLILESDKFNMLKREEISDILDPMKFVGRAPEQVVEFVEEYLDPAIEPFKEYLGNVDVDLKV
ncbi:adenylosuccinate lyase [Intestinibacter bartlettii DSM 16795]|jgi:adenylosuccinate lyase|uniref:Adenylosuccinate lyase n=3 Tax=Intestinibacter bartlettii TaxID=261299 RepID=R5XFW9_9FIRM|nr:adenylosuccinate lyase [Intestinibacter bartlettii]KMW26540.1 adenylosuccinate lyase [Clostridium sp. 1_1_41A1FAA]MDU1252953.1 adenylosuccinate lyase [Peptostreptococcaceae bacterium]MDU5920161.1 adenylosuccinate lyase [Clostridiales bacterium]SCI37206.1 Adenylosuccinate lyase [uncultured Clostridium sp.]EDQ96376.1 adenylosuccinate lyase [Intestinibacter bartlettii DSM 16795]